MPVRSDLDRSTMFTNLLTLSAKFGALDSRVGRQVVSQALAAWYDSTDTDMYAFAKAWLQKERKDLLPLKA